MGIATVRQLWTGEPAEMTGRDLAYWSAHFRIRDREQREEYQAAAVAARAEARVDNRGAPWGAER